MSTAPTIFPYFTETFDSQKEQKEYTFKFRLLPGEAIATYQVEQVDITGKLLIDPVQVLFGPRSSGLISTRVYGVTQWFLPGMTDSGFTAYIRCVVTTDYAGPIPHIYSRCMRLNIR